MTDAAAGGQAALQLQQSMAAAPYVQEQTDAAAEQTQLKLQQDRLKLEQDRLKASYAPEALALQLQQDQENLAKTRFANTVGEINLKDDKTSREVLQDLYKDPAFKLLDPGDQQRKIGASLQERGLVEQGAKALVQADVSDLRKLTNELKQHESNRVELNKTVAYLTGASDEQVKELISKMPQAMKDTIDKQLPNWSKQTDTKLQKAQLEALSRNGLDKNDLGTHQKRLEVLDKEIELQSERIRVQEAILENARNRGNRGSGGGTSADDKREDSQYRQARRDAIRIDADYKKPIKEAEDAWKKAWEQDNKKTGLFALVGGGSSAIADAKDSPDKTAELKSSKAWNDLQAIKKEVIEKRLNVLEGMPEGKQKDKLFELYQRELMLVDTAVPGVVVGKIPPPAKGGMPTNAKTHDGYPARKNADGSYSTELSITVTNPKLNGGKPTNIPSLWKGKEVNEETAVANALASGAKYDSFSTIPEAVSAAKEKSKGGGAAATSNNQPVKLTQAENDAAVDRANEALKKGANREEVMARLKAAGVKFKME